MPGLVADRLEISIVGEDGAVLHASAVVSSVSGCLDRRVDRKRTHVIIWAPVKEAMSSCSGRPDQLLSDDSCPKATHNVCGLQLLGGVGHAVGQNQAALRVSLHGDRIIEQS